MDISKETTKIKFKIMMKNFLITYHIPYKSLHSAATE